MAGVARHLFSGACRLDLLTAGGAQKDLKAVETIRQGCLEPPSAVSNLTAMDSNAEIFATHLEQAQWAPPAIEGVDDIDTDLF